MQHRRLEELPPSRFNRGHHTAPPRVGVVTEIVAVDPKHTLEGARVRGQVDNDLTRGAHGDPVVEFLVDDQQRVPLNAIAHQRSWLEPGL